MASRKEILEMLSRGEIDVHRATELLAHPQEFAPETTPEITPDSVPGIAPEPAPAPPEAFAPQPPPIPVPAVAAPPAPEPPPAPGRRRWLHIHVSALDTGRSRVRVNVPLGLVRFGMRVGARFTDELDRSTIGDVLRAIDQEEISGTLLEVEDISDNERVHIYID